jgi:hypothetical protein
LPDITDVRLETDLWKISNGSVEEYLPKTKRLVTQLAAQMQYRHMDDIPQSKGACIFNALIAASSYERENFTAGIRMQTPEFSVTITSETSGPREHGQTLWDRMDKSDKMIKEVYGTSLPIGVIRRAEVTVDGRKGQEYISITPEKGMETFIAKAEIYGDSTPRKPTFKIEMDTSWMKSPSQEQKKKMLSKETSLALWDAILKSIRPRPEAS